MVEIKVEEQEKYLLGLKSIEEAYEYLEKLAKGGLGQSELSSFMMKVAEKFKLSKDDVKNFTTSLIDAKAAALDFINSSDSISSSLEFMKDISEKSEKALDNFKTRMGDSSLTAAQFGAKLAAISPWGLKMLELPKYMETVGASAKTMQGQMADLFSDDKLADKAATQLSSAFGKIITKEDIVHWAKFYDLQRNLEIGMMQTAATGGNFNGFLAKAGQNFEHLADISTKYTEEIEAMSIETGLSTKQTAELQQKLDMLPRTYNQLSSSTGETAGKQKDLVSQQKELVTIMQLSRGAGLDANKVMEDMAFLSVNLGKEGEGALSFIQRLGSVTQATGLPMNETREAIKAVTEQFASMGDNTDAAINILGRLSPALREVGAAPAQTIRIFKDLTSSMKGMSTAQAAFLSASTGGPSGLQGAFKIKNMIRAGKTDEVMSKMQESLRSKMGGGPLVTSQQAEESPEKAAQYQRQQMLIMSPAMGGMAKDEDSARYLLDAMAKGDLKGFAAGMTGSTEGEKDVALKKAIDTGNSLIKRSNHWLETMAKLAEAKSGLAAAGLSDAMPVLDEYTRKAVGFKSKKQETRDALSLVDETNGASTSAIVGGSGPDKDASNKVFKRLVSSDVEDKWKEDKLGALKSAFGNLTSEIGFVNKPDFSFETDGSKEPDEQSPQAPSPDQRTRKVFKRADEAKVTRQDKREQVSPEVKVNVQTICMACNQKMTDDAIKNALQHQHGSNNSKAQTGAGR